MTVVAGSTISDYDVGRVVIDVECAVGDVVGNDVGDGHIGRNGDATGQDSAPN